MSSRLQLPSQMQSSATFWSVPAYSKSTINIGPWVREGTQLSSVPVTLQQKFLVITHLHVSSAQAQWLSREWAGKLISVAKYLFFHLDSRKWCWRGWTLKVKRCVVLLLGTIEFLENKYKPDVKRHVKMEKILYLTFLSVLCFFHVSINSESWNNLKITPLKWNMFLRCKPVCQLTAQSTLYSWASEKK